MEVVRSWDDAESFAARAWPFLLAREAEHNLLFGLLAAIRGGDYPDWFAWTVERGDEVALAALRTPPHNIVLSLGDERAVRALAGHLTGSGLPGVNGIAEQARWFADAWGAGEPVRAEGVYALTEVRHPDDVAGTARAPSPADRELIAAWMPAFQREVVTPTGVFDPPAALAWAKRRIERGTIALWEADGAPVSLAGWGGPTPNGIRIGPVYTPPAARGRGYAGALVAEVSARRLAEGRRFCFLYTDLGNPTSNGVYQRIGYRRVAEAAVYRFG